LDTPGLVLDTLGSVIDTPRALITHLSTAAFAFAVWLKAAPGFALNPEPGTLIPNLWTLNPEPWTVSG